MTKRLLVVVDMQNDFVSGTLGSKAAQNIVPNVLSLIEKERARGTEAVFTKDTHGEDYPATQEGRMLPVPHCKKGTDGWELFGELKTLAGDSRIFEKGTFGSLELGEYAREQGFSEIVLCGVCTDICVISNALLIKAYCPEAAVRVISAACAGTSPHAHAAALTAMQSCQIIVE